MGVNYQPGYRPERQSRVKDTDSFYSNYEKAFGKWFVCVCGAQHKVKPSALPVKCSACQSTIDHVGGVEQ